MPLTWRRAKPSQFSCFTHLILYTIFAGAVAGRGLYSESVLPIHIVDMNCTGSEHNIWECGHNGLISVYSCASRNDASVRCQGILITIIVILTRLV